jgi:hypothetical protein
MNPPKVSLGWKWTWTTSPYNPQHKWTIILQKYGCDNWGDKPPTHKYIIGVITFVDTKRVRSQSNELVVTKDSRIIVLLWSFSLSHRKDFWVEIFCNMLLKIHIFSINHIFCINFSWISFFFKMYKFYQILCFILKNYLNFKLYENMLII